ncbi:ribonuclease H-like domain-containing protein [Tanacetum coccineum]
MAYSSTSSTSSTNSEVSNDSNCCSSCLECVKDLKEQNEQLVKDLRTVRISVVSYKTGLESVEARLLVFKKNKSVYVEDIKLLKREIYSRDLDITELKRKLELATKEKDEIMDKCKTGLGYNVVPPPYTGNFMPPKPDLVYPSLVDFVDVNESVSESIVKKPNVETNEPKTARKENEALIIEDWVSESGEEDAPKVKTVEMFNKPSFAKINLVKSTDQTKTPRKTSVEKNRQNTPSPRGNKRNRNQQMSQRLRSDFEMINKVCHVCGSFEYLRKDCTNWYNNQRVNTVKGTRVNTARPKAVISVVKGNKRNVVKASAYWVWRPKHKILDHVSRKNGNPQQDLKDKGVIDSGCSRHMTKNRSYFIDYEEIDRGFVAFGDFKLTGESHVLLKVPRKDNMYSVDVKNVIPQGGLTCHFAKVTPDESNLWHRRLGHVNFKTINKLVRGNLVRGLPLKHLKLIKPVLLVRRESNTELLVRPKQVLVIKPHNKTPYELFLGRKPALSFMRPFGCSVIILNTIDHIAKFDGKADEGFFLGYSTNSKAFGVFTSRTMIVEENLHIQFRNQSNGSAGTKACDNAGKARVKTDAEDPGNYCEVPSIEELRINQENDDNVNINNNINTVSPTVNAASIEDNVVDENIIYGCVDDPNIPDLEEIGIFSDAENDDSGAEINNLDTYFQVSHILTTRIHKDHPVEQIIRDLNSAPQTRRMTKNLKEHGLFSS